MKTFVAFLFLLSVPFLAFGLNSTELNGIYKCVGVIEVSGRVNLDDPLMNQTILVVKLKGFYYEITSKLLDDKVHIVALRQDEFKEVYVSLGDEEVKDAKTKDEKGNDVMKGRVQALNIGPYLGSTFLLLQTIGEANTRKTYVIQKVTE